METKYGQQLPDELLVAYVDGMIAKVWKMIPIKQSGVKTLPKYIESTLREFNGVKDLVLILSDNGEFLAVLGVMESLLKQDDFSKFKSDVFRIINIIERLRLSLGGVSE